MITDLMIIRGVITIQQAVTIDTYGNRFDRHQEALAGRNKGT